MLSKFAIVSTLLTLGAVALGGMSPGQSPNPEEPAVRAALEHYLQGHATGQGAHFSAAMHQQGTMYWAKDGTLSTRPFTEYIAGASGKPAADEAKRKRRIEMVDITGDAAVGKITLDYPDVTLTDYMTLLKVDGKWQIVAKAFTRQSKAS